MTTKELVYKVYTNNFIIEDTPTQKLKHPLFELTEFEKSCQQIIDFTRTEVANKFGYTPEQVDGNKLLLCFAMDNSLIGYCKLTDLLSQFKGQANLDTVSIYCLYGNNINFNDRNKLSIRKETIYSGLKILNIKFTEGGYKGIEDYFNITSSVRPIEQNTGENIRSLTGTVPNDTQQTSDNIPNPQPTVTDSLLEEGQELPNSNTTEATLETDVQQPLTAPVHSADNANPLPIFRGDLEGHQEESKLVQTAESIKTSISNIAKVKDIFKNKQSVYIINEKRVKDSNGQSDDINLGNAMSLLHIYRSKEFIGTFTLVEFFSVICVIAKDGPVEIGDIELFVNDDPDWTPPKKL